MKEYTKKEMADFLKRGIDVDVFEYELSDEGEKVWLPKYSYLLIRKARIGDYELLLIQEYAPEFVAVCPSDKVLIVSVENIQTHEPGSVMMYDFDSNKQSAFQAYDKKYDELLKK